MKILFTLLLSLCVFNLCATEPGEVDINQYIQYDRWNSPTTSIQFLWDTQVDPTDPEIANDLIMEIWLPSQGAGGPFILWQSVPFARGTATLDTELLENVDWPELNTQFKFTVRYIVDNVRCLYEIGEVTFDNGQPFPTQHNQAWVWDTVTNTFELKTVLLAKPSRE